MKVLRYKIDHGNIYNYYLINNNKKLGIIFCGNDDLYFTPFELGQEVEFFITKENMYIYNLFDELLKAFEEVNVFQVNTMQSLYNNFEYSQKIYEEVYEKNQKLRNSEIYKKVFSNGKIIWISDDSISFDYKTADAMVISNEGDYFKLKFTYYENQLPYIKSIRIRNARSRYKPFNTLMMDFYNNLQKYDPNYHQIQIDEYMYMKEKQKKLIK